MTKAIELLINLPFPGFYDSLLSGAIDSQEEQHCEYEEEYRQAENGIPKELHLTANELAEILCDVTDYKVVHEAVAKSYVDAFDQVASEEIGLDLGLRFESMTSPRFYNFETDRLFAHIKVSVVKRLFAKSRRDKHQRLAAVIEERFTSYDGFHSHYSNDLDAWLEKPVLEWDHNELGTLLIAALPEPDSRDERIDWRVYEVLCDCDGLYHEWESGVDWPKYEAKVEDMRANKEFELRANDPSYVPPPYRCLNTPDLFLG